jgi:1-deoxy-D-xylulose-5-phosphate synthase
MVQVALDAAKILDARGISLAVGDARFIKPLDLAMVRRAAEFPLVATIEEGTEAGGFGDAVLAQLAADGYRGRFLRRAVPDRYIEHMTRAEQLEDVGLTAPQVAQALQLELDASQDAS